MNTHTAPAHTDPVADMRERFRPSQEAIEAALELCRSEVLEDAYAVVLLPGKIRGFWTTGQPVIALPFAYLTRREAVAAGEAVMAGQEGTFAYASIYDDGTWAVFEW